MMTTTDQDRPSLQFYDRIRLLNPSKDQQLRLRPPANYRFTAQTNAIPLVAEEFYTAQAYYPIVFAGTDQPRPVAVVGLKSNENLFIEADGTWRADHYMPLYVRRHPFILVDLNDGRLHLGIDEASSRWSSEDGQKLFEDNEPAELTKGMLDFCTKYRTQHKISADLGEALREQAVLTEYRFDITAAGQTHAVSGCQVVSEEKLAAVPDDVFLAWRRAGWLPLITAHLLSLRQWQSLGRISAERSHVALAA
jgi:hypothetical protein